MEHCLCYCKTYRGLIIRVQKQLTRPKRQEQPEHQERRERPGQIGKHLKQILQA